MISIVIATFNRCESLRETLESLCAQDFKSLGEEVEIVVINNNSTDRTAEVIAETAKKAPCEMRGIFEPRQGISAARNRGISESRGEFLFFTDDDVIVQPGWIHAYQQAFRESGADCAGGKIVPLWGKKPEPWMLSPELIPIINGSFALLDHGPAPFILKELNLNFFYGANMAFRKAAFGELGGFREDRGMVGNKRLYGEDTDMIFKFFNAGKKMVYAPSAVVHHKVPAFRMTLSYVRKWRFDKALDSPPVGFEKTLPPFWLFKECVSNGGSALMTYCQGKQIAGIAKELQFWTQLGQIAGLLRR